jgi:hypothetical protein
MDEQGESGHCKRPVREGSFVPNHAGLAPGTGSCLWQGRAESVDGKGRAPSGNGEGAVLMARLAHAWAEHSCAIPWTSQRLSHRRPGQPSPHALTVR